MALTTTTTTTTSILLSLVMTCVAQAIPPGGSYGSHHPGPHGPSFESVAELVNTVLSEVEKLFHDIGSVRTLCAVDQERISIIKGRHLDFFDLKNKQQDAVTERFSAQAKDLQHRVDSAESCIDGVLERAVDTSTELSHLGADLVTQSNIDSHQQGAINSLLGELAATKARILNELHANITELGVDVDDAEGNLTHIAEFILSRKCEYGVISVCPGEEANVTFKTLFERIPEISLSLIGFSGHLDGHSYDLSSLGFNVTVVELSTNGFSVDVASGSSGVVQLGHVSYSFMACQNLRTHTKPCNTTDVVFLVDASGSVNPAEFSQALQFVKDVVLSLEVGPTKAQIGLMTFSTNATIEFNLNDFNTTGDILAAFGNVTQSGGSTRTDLALDLLLTQMFTAANGDRPAVPNFAVVITDGMSTQPTLTQTSAANARAAGITLVSVGVGSEISVAELNGIATDPDATNVFFVPNFASLSDLVETLWSTVCVQ